MKNIVFLFLLFSFQLHAQSKRDSSESNSDKLTIHAQTKRDSSESISDKLTDLKARFTTLEKSIASEKSKTKIGLSVGIRGPLTDGAYSRHFCAGYVSPIDSSAYIEFENRRSALVLSAILQNTPFEGFTNSWYKNIGFILNVNLAQISDGGASSIFNKEIDGGFGISYDFNQRVAIAFTLEYVLNRSLRGYYIDLIEEADKNGTKIKLKNQGQVVTNIQKNDDTFYHNDNYFAQSLKLVFFF